MNSNLDNIAIDFHFYNSSTGVEVDKSTVLMIDMSLPSYERESIAVDVILKINGEDIKGYIDPFILKNHSTVDVHKNEKTGELYSNFYVISCSCGEAGCYGIWDGVHIEINEDKNIISWKVPENMGYEGKGLNLSGYTFALNLYQMIFAEALLTLEKKLKENEWNQEVVEVSHGFSVKEFFKHVRN